jgi:hypothetical protein
VSFSTDIQQHEVRVCGIIPELRKSSITWHLLSYSLTIDAYGVFFAKPVVIDSQMRLELSIISQIYKIGQRN